MGIIGDPWYEETVQMDHPKWDINGTVMRGLRFQGYKDWTDYRCQIRGLVTTGDTDQISLIYWIHPGHS